MAGEKATEGLPTSVRRPHSPSALVAFTACLHRAELERAAEAGVVDRPPRYPSAGRDALAERGRAHEKAHLDDLRAQGLEVVEIPTDIGFPEGARLTAEAMARGVSVIYQATFARTEGPAGSIRKSTIHRYRFVAQEHDLETGDDVEARRPGHANAEVAGNGKGTDKDTKKTRGLTIHALDEAAGTFDVTVGKGRPAPEIGALIPKCIVPSDHHRARLLELAEWTAKYGIDGDGIHQQARDLILRIPPPGSGPAVATTEGDRPALVHAGEPAQEAAVRVALELARSDRGGRIAR